MDQTPTLLTTGDVARITGFSIAKIRKLIDAGRLPAVNGSSTDRPRWAIRREDLDAFLQPSNIAPRKKPKPARRQRIDRNVPQVF